MKIIVDFEDHEVVDIYNFLSRSTEITSSFLMNLEALLCDIAKPALKKAVIEHLKSNEKLCGKLIQIQNKTI
jgi:hypothetical protein